MHLNLIKHQGGQIGRAIGSGDSNLTISKGYEIGRKGPRGQKGWQPFLNFHLVRNFNLCYLVTIYPLKLKGRCLHWYLMELEFENLL